MLASGSKVVVLQATIPATRGIVDFEILAIPSTNELAQSFVNLVGLPEGLVEIGIHDGSFVTSREAEAPPEQFDAAHVILCNSHEIEPLEMGLVILLYRLRSRRGAGGDEKGSRQAVPV